MNIHYVLSITDISEDFTAKIYEAVSPSAEIGSINVPAPHSATFDVLFSGLDKITHIVRLFGNTSGTLYQEFSIQPYEGTIQIFDDIRFKIGDGQPLTPPANTADYTNPVLIGLDFNKEFRVWRNGFGFLYPTLHYSFDSATGTISLTYPDQFGDGEEILITREVAPITTVINDSVVGKQFGGNSAFPDIFIDVVSTVNYIPGHLRHIIRLAGANANYVFPLGAAIPIGYIFRLTNFGAYASPSDKGKVTFGNAPLIWGSTPKTELDIPFTGTYEFEFDGTNWNCTIFNTTQDTGVPTIVFAQSYIIGNVTTADQLFTIPIPTQPYDIITSVGKYVVSGNLVGLVDADWNNNNDVAFIVTEKRSTYFKIAIKKLSGATPYLGFDFILVR